MKIVIALCIVCLLLASCQPSDTTRRETSQETPTEQHEDTEPTNAVRWFTDEPFIPPTSPLERVILGEDVTLASGTPVRIELICPTDIEQVDWTMEPTFGADESWSAGSTTTIHVDFSGEMRVGCSRSGSRIAESTITVPNGQRADAFEFRVLQLESEPNLVHVICQEHPGIRGTRTRIDFGDGTTEESTFGSETHTYEQPGTYSIGCSIGEDGAMFSDDIRFEVLEEMPTIDKSGLDLRIERHENGILCTLTDRASADSWELSYHDRSGLTVQTGKHWYSVFSETLDDPRSVTCTATFNEGTTSEFTVSKTE